MYNVPLPRYMQFRIISPMPLTTRTTLFIDLYLYDVYAWLVLVRHMAKIFTHRHSIHRVLYKIR